MPQREQCHTVEPMILEKVKYGRRKVILFNATYNYRDKTFVGYIINNKRAEAISLCIGPQMAARACSDWIQGWITADQRTWLYKTAGECPANLAIIEIGAWKGKSTVILGWGSKAGNGAKVISIDPHQGTPSYWVGTGGITMSTWKQYRANITASGLDDIVIPYREPSLVALEYLSNQTAGLLFIDGDHDYAAQDAANWWAQVAPGGWLAMHDIHRPEVLQGIEIIKETGLFSKPVPIDGMAVMQRE